MSLSSAFKWHSSRRTEWVTAALHTLALEQETNDRVESDFHGLGRAWLNLKS